MPMSIQERSEEVTDWPGRIVEGAFNYLADPYNTNPARRLHYYPDIGGSSNIAFAPCAALVRDARPRSTAFMLDRQGFELVRSSAPFRPAPSRPRSHRARR